MEVEGATQPNPLPEYSDPARTTERGATPPLLPGTTALPIWLHPFLT